MCDASILNFVIPVKAGIHWLLKFKLDPRLLGDDGLGDVAARFVNP